MIAEKPTVPEVLPLVRAYYDKPGNGIGGSLHVVLEDGNIDTKSVEFCRQWALDRDDEDGVSWRICSFACPEHNGGSSIAEVVPIC